MDPSQNLVSDAFDRIGADIHKGASRGPSQDESSSRAERPDTKSAGAAIRLASLVAALLSYPPSAAADLLQDMLRKGVEAATQEMRRQESRPTQAPAAPAPLPPAAPRPTPDVAPAAAQAASPAVVKQPELHPDEINFVAPSATTRLSETERCFSLGQETSGAKARCPLHKPVENAELMRGELRASYPSEFLTFRNSPRMIVDNPYLSLDRGFFNKIRGAACNPNTTGELWVTSTAWLKRNNNPYASGIWRIAPDGQIMALAAKPWALESSSRHPYCNAPFQKSGLEVKNLTKLTPGADGSMLAISDDLYYTISRIQADGTVQYVAGSGACAAGATKSKGYVDGGVTEARFKGITAVLEDPQKNIWVGDFGNCALRKISGGRVSTVVPPERACPKNDPENHLTFDSFAWDPNSGELIAAGTHLWRGPPTGDNYFSSIWRISADGSMNRLYRAKAMGSGPNSGVGGVWGLALDRAGAIWFAEGYFGTKEGVRIMHIDPSGRLVHVAGSPLPVNVSHGDGPAREALFKAVESMCFDSQETLFMYGDNMIRKMTRDGRVTTWAY